MWSASAEGDYNPKLVFGGSVVAKLINNLPKDFSFNVTFNNLFTSLNLLVMWIVGTSTLR